MHDGPFHWKARALLGIFGHDDERRSIQGMCGDVSLAHLTALQAGRFAHNLRCQLWREHLGIQADDVSIADPVRGINLLLIQLTR